MADLSEAQATANIRRVARQRLGPAEASTRHASEALLGSINALHVSEALTVARYRRAQDAAFRARVQQAKVRASQQPSSGCCREGRHPAAAAAAAGAAARRRRSDPPHPTSTPAQAHLHPTHKKTADSDP